MSPEETKSLEQLCVNSVRMLAVDMVEKARSGHPGLPLGAAPMVYTLWAKFLRHHPDHPTWPNRDRFILSAGHGSALLYALLHLFGYPLSLDDLKNFRQWGSLTPGHPEYGLTPGVEATTGPLGQGFAMGVGMAIAEQFLAGTYNRPGFDLIDHYTYALVSDGDLMEGISSEAASLAATLGLGKLIYLYDDNGISIEGSTDLTFTEDVSRRFQAYGWQVIRVSDGNDVDSITKAIVNARSEKDRPSLIMVKTLIGYGSPKQDSAACHGEPLGSEATKATKKFFGWPSGTDFHVPEEVRAHMQKIRNKAQAPVKDWHDLLGRYKSAFPGEASTLEAAFNRTLPGDLGETLPKFKADQGALATRVASGKVINALATKLPNLVGGSADLAPSNKTWLTGYGDLAQPGGRNIHFGVREHAMGAIINGLNLHGGIIPFGGTFLVFADYMRPALRLAAMMKLPSIFVFTHDSIGVGEDGPTHQPIEHLASLRAIPGMTVVRPAEANETAQAWKCALTNSGPTALILSRQNLPTLGLDSYPIADGVGRGAYVLADADGPLQCLLLASGSEVHLVLGARDCLTAEGYRVRVISIPSWELFAAQPLEYQQLVLPPAVKARVAVEAGCSFGWRRWVGECGELICLDHFGASAPGNKIYEEFGFTAENVVSKAKAAMAKTNR